MRRNLQPRPTSLTPSDGRVIEQIGSAAGKHLSVQLRDVQVEAGIELLCRSVAEMSTGEGKTLTTVIPAAVIASRGGPRGNVRVLVATANDYLAARDAEWMRPIFDDLGLRVGCVASQSSSDQRSRAYRCDVVYGTIRQFAFDYLREALDRCPASDDDRDMAFPFDALIVDEADSLLIDEAKTPMIIHSPIGAAGNIDPAIEACYRWSAETAVRFLVEDDYVRLPDGSIALTELGRRRAIQTALPDTMGSLVTTDILHSLQRAIWVNENIIRDKHYVVNDGRIQIVDEYTGRKSDQRNFGSGIHQAVEARESIDVTPPSHPVARISVQDFVVKFRHLSGLTATAWEDRQELRRVYRLSVRRFDTHVPSRRRILEPVVCRSRQEAWNRIVDETQQLVAAGRAVLIGTRTITRSEELSDWFRKAEIEHVVLNARNVKQESGIVASAGMPGRVTIATNMAGRGTDIQLDRHVADAGGLHVIVSEPHAASRIDRQLMGRCGRQGDPGTARLYASPDDEIFVQAFGAERADRIRRKAQSGAPDRWLLSNLKQAQRRVARQHQMQRAQLTAHEAGLAESMQLLGLDPHLDPIVEPT